MIHQIGDKVSEDLGRQLEDEILSLKSKIASLKKQREIQTANIITSRTSQSILARLQQSASNSSPVAQDESGPFLADVVLDYSAKHTARNRECLFRMCAGVTTFKVQDPDPYAVDEGMVIGLRFEVFASGKFLRPLYVFLNKPYSSKDVLRVHRHTVPPCIPLAELAKKYLPTPNESGSVLKAKRQDLNRFARTLRKEIANYYNRAACIAGMRKTFRLDVPSRKGKEKHSEIVDVSAVDAEAKMVRLEWEDGSVGRVVIDERGFIAKCVVVGAGNMEKKGKSRHIVGGSRRFENLVERLN